MATLEAIRTALANVISAAVTNANVSPVYVQQVNPPQIVIDVQPQVEVWATLEGAVDYLLRVILIAGAGEDASAQALLDGWIDPNGPGSVVAAINQNPRLTQAGQPTVSYTAVTRIGVPGGAASRGGYGIVQWAGVDYFGTNILVEVLA